MANLKTYSILNDTSDGVINADRLEYEIRESGYVTGYDGFYIDGDNIHILGDSISSIGSPSNEFLLDKLINDHDGINIYAEYKLLLDVHDVNKSVSSINYKIELDSGVSYTPVFTIHLSGESAGFIEKTEYYKNYVDENNLGELILIVYEDYVIDNSDLTIPFTARPAISRTKTWKWVKDDGSIDEINVKTKTKQYNTRRKRKIEAERRRDNIVEQLIDHVGLAGVLSGAFSSSDDAYDKLTALQEKHANAFTGWRSSGRGSLTSVITHDVDTSWLNLTIPNTTNTQAMCPWMIGMKFSEYIVDKLLGNIA